MGINPEGGAVERSEGLPDMQQMLITTPEFNQRLDLIRHLIGSSDRIPLIRGVDGVGKSTLLTRLREIAPDDWDVCRFEATAMLQPEQLGRVLSGCYASSGELLGDSARLLRRFADYHQAGRLPVLLVDDAHLLPIATMLELINLHIAAHRQGSRIALVFAASTAIDQQINSGPLQPVTHLLQTLELLPFNLEQTERMVREALALGGQGGEIDKPSSWVGKIYQESGGVPGKIREQLDAALGKDGVALALPGSVASKRWFLRDIPLPVIAGSLLLALLMGLTLVFQDEINAVFEPEASATGDRDQTLAELPRERMVPLTLPEQVEAEPATGAVELAELAGPPEQEPTSPILEQATDTALESDALPATAAGNIPAPAAGPDSGAEVPAAPAPEPQVSGSDAEPEIALEAGEKLADEGAPPPATIPPADRSDAQPRQTPEPAAPNENRARHPSAEAETSAPKKAKPATAVQREPTVDKPAVDPSPVPVVEQSRKVSPPLAEGRTTATTEEKAKGKKAAAPVVDEGIRREAWLLKQRADAYTLQLIGLKDEAGVDKFIRHNKLQGKVAYFRSLRRGTPWYSVVYGVYPNRSEATAAKANLPKNLAGQGVWPRSIGSIQEAIRVR